MIYHSNEDEKKTFCFNVKVLSFEPEFVWSNDNNDTNFKITIEYYTSLNCNIISNTIGKKFDDCNVDGNIVNIKMNLFNESAGYYFITLNNKELVGFYAHVRCDRHQQYKQREPEHRRY